jgi:MEDS: MEthanogen/methylotroph, DcmR Sensory domain
VVTGTEVLDTGRGEHVVLFYRDQEELAARVSEYLLPAVAADGVAIVLATPDHCQSFERRLAGAGADVAAARARGSYLAIDANETMRRFMVADWPDPASFWREITPLLGQPAKGPPVRVFGEMVSLLWDAGLVNAAIEVEAMWNELGGQYSFSLLCAYPAQSFSCAHHLDAVTEVCRAHAEVIGRPSEPEA